MLDRLEELLDTANPTTEEVSQAFWGAPDVSVGSFAAGECWAEAADGEHGERDQRLG